MIAEGKFISLEGIDGSGKTSLIHFLGEHIRDAYKLKIVMVREPGGTHISEKIRDLLLDISNEGIMPKTEAMLYAAARSQVVEEVIRPALHKGEIVIADRYLDSTIAYQGYGRGLDLNFLKEINYLCTGGLMPDITLLLDLDPVEGQRRRIKDIPDRLEKEGLRFQNLVRQGYLELARQEPQRIKIIKANANLEAVVEEAIKHIEAALRND